MSLQSVSIRALQALGLAVLPLLTVPSLHAQPTVDIALYPSATPGAVEVRLRPNGSFDQLLSNMVFTISWPASSGVTLDDAQLVSLCSAIPIVPNGDGMQQAGGLRYQTYFMLGLQSLAAGCPLVNGQELTVMRIPLVGLTTCTSLNIAHDGYTGSHNKDYYVSLNGLDRTGAIYSTPVSQCACTKLRLDITTDNHPGELGLEIRDAASGTIVLSGNMPPSQTDRTVHIPTCLDQGCYRLKVTDAGGNGISGGGYVLHKGSQRIIDASGAFGSVSAIADNGTFCVPLGPAFLKPTSCDQMSIGLNDILRAKRLSTADGYGFEVFDPHGSFDTTVFRDGPNLKFTAGLWNRIPHDLELNIRVNARIGGVFGSFGKICTAQLGSSPGMALGVDEYDMPEGTRMSIYPNPLQEGSFHLLYGEEGNGSGHGLIEVFSGTGQRLAAEQVDFQGRLDHVMSLPANSAAGIYMVMFTTATDRQTSIVVQP
jgi:hypothetical protein